MFVDLLTGILSGFILSTQLDLSNIEAFQRGLRQGFRESLLVSLGSTAGDAIYWVVMLLGQHQILHSLQTNKIYIVIYGLFLLVLGYLSFLDLKKFEEKKYIYKNRVLIFVMSPFVAGFMMSVMNPSTVLWSFVVTEIFEEKLIPREVVFAREPHIFVGLLIGGILWAFFLALLASRSKKLIGDRVLKSFMLANCFLFFISSIVIIARAI